MNGSHTSRSFIVRLAAPVWALALSGGLVVAEVTTVPLELQSALLKKVFSFDKTLALSDGVEVLVVYEGSPGEDHGKVVQAFSDLSVPARSVQLPDLEREIGPGTVVYVSRGTASVKDLSHRHGTLTIGGCHSLVEAGEAVLGIGMVEGKPRIFINRSELRASGHELSSKLLQLATLVD